MQQDASAHDVNYHTSRPGWHLGSPVDGLRHGSLSPDLTMALAADAAARRVLKAQQPGPEKPRKLRRGSLRILAYTTHGFWATA
jgi:hypothetical protein